jgi:serine/threonine-protein kinase RsbW
MAMQRIPVEEFINREAELAKLCAFAQQGRTANVAPSMQTNIAAQKRSMNALLLGVPRVGKTELLRRTYDQLFAEAGDVVPFFFSLRRTQLEPLAFARLYLTEFLSQFIAFRHQDENLFSGVNELLPAITQKALPDDYPWISHLALEFTKAEREQDALAALKLALAAPLTAARQTSLQPFLMLDNAHLIVDADVMLRNELLQSVAMEEHSSLSRTKGITFPAFLLCGLQRPMVEMLPADEGLFERLHLFRIEVMAVEQLEGVIQSIAFRQGIEISDSNIELMIQQLNGDIFYIRSILDAAAINQARLKSFMDFERLYTEEVLRGRIGYYLDSLLTEIAPLRQDRRAVLELLSLILPAAKPLPFEIALARLQEYTENAESLLARLHSREFITVKFNFVEASTDPVLADFVRVKYRQEIASATRPVAGDELLGEKLKHSYQLTMSRYHRSIELQLIELLAHFDFQSVPMSLFNTAAFNNQYQGMNRTQIRRQLDEETEKMRLPQIVVVNDVASLDYTGATIRLFTASGFDGGIYSAANEALWLVALINSREPFDLEMMRQIEQRFAVASRSVLLGKAEHAVRWYISKEGFSQDALTALGQLKAHHSTYAQLDMLSDTIGALSLPDVKARTISEIELTIPIDEEAELIAARTVEQVARAADFDKEAINQIKTALIEACINAAEHGDSPDRKIYQRFALEADRLIITVSNKGKAFAGNGKEMTKRQSQKGARGRGLQIIRGLMDDVRFEPTDDGTTLIMTKLLKRAETQ